MLNEILSYNRGQIIVDKTQLEKDCFLLDYDTELKLEMKTDSSILLNNRIYKLRLKRYIDFKICYIFAVGACKTVVTKFGHSSYRGCNAQWLSECKLFYQKLQKNIRSVSVKI